MIHINLIIENDNDEDDITMTLMNSNIRTNERTNERMKILFSLYQNN
jgi:hypothetical protein